jgi:hypothetical protein
MAIQRVLVRVFDDDVIALEPWIAESPCELELDAGLETAPNRGSTVAI